MTITNKPLKDPIYIDVSKVDASTKDKVAIGDSELTGAQYTVEYYASDKASGAPVATWIFEVDKENKIYYDEAHLVVGSQPLSLDTQGKAIFPVGTLTVKETKAPEGYNLDKTTYTVRIKLVNGKFKVTTDNDDNEYVQSKSTKL